MMYIFSFKIIIYLFYFSNQHFLGVVLMWYLIVGDCG